jgi:hypothetical protein
VKKEEGMALNPRGFSDYEFPARAGGVLESEPPWEKVLPHKEKYIN